MKISSLIEQRGDIHHLFPAKYLSKNGYTPKQYNQVANYAYTEQPTNIKIGMLPPKDYMQKVKNEIATGVLNITSVDSETILADNLVQKEEG